ncbi:MAG: BamA/TamA family outer membrane protein [Chitinophagaceae bacterium]|nr:BamA/TamA family outer membrane protein [Chitinophagaceae bacterium]
MNVQMVERKDSTGKLDMIVQLVPGKKYGFEGKLEASYSTNSNSNNVNVANAGNLLGLSGNISLQSRNAGRQGIKVTHALRTGVELNLNARPNAENFINSSDVGYNLTFAFPKLLLPKNLRDYFNKNKKIDNLYSKQSFISFSASNTNRIGLFRLNSFGLAGGYEWSPRPNKTWSLKLVNIEYSNLYNRSLAFDSTLNENPFLRYSFNTALVFGSTLGYTWININPKHPNRVFSLKANIEESGWFLSILPLKDFSSINKDLRSFIKGDVEAIYTIKKSKSEIAYRGFLGIGVPIGSGDTTLPFFKQYFGGGPNSMRAWPIRGIGPGSKPLPTYNSRRLSDRTGDIRLELNAEYRKDIWQMIPNTLTLKWALFADIGNVWNFKNTQPDGSYDSTQFQFKNLYHDLGMNVGTGFRLDFNYVVLRFDFGFRVKRPELSENGGWKLPSIGFDDLWGKLFKKGNNEEYRKWRYENFNFTIGLNYPF